MDDRDFTAEEILNVKKDISDIISKALQDAVKIGHTEPIMMMLCVCDTDSATVSINCDDEVEYTEVEEIEFGRLKAKSHGLIIGFNFVALRLRL